MVATEDAGGDNGTLKPTMMKHVEKWLDGVGDEGTEDPSILYPCYEAQYPASHPPA